MHNCVILVSFCVMAASVTGVISYHLPGLKHNLHTQRVYWLEAMEKWIWGDCFTFYIVMMKPKYGCIIHKRLKPGVLSDVTSPLAMNIGYMYEAKRDSIIACKRDNEHHTTADVIYKYTHKHTHTRKHACTHMKAHTHTHTHTRTHTQCSSKYIYTSIIVIYK